MSKSIADLFKEGSLKGKSIEQILFFAGKLKDGENPSEQFREFLTYSSSSDLENYSDFCLTNPFTDSGLALQDTINEVGRRLGFNVTNGRYRGRKGENGFDGLWESKPNSTLIVEVKTTDSYRIKLDTIANYKAQLKETNAAILLIVGRDDTGELEAQIRGSKHAWDMRLISIDSLFRLLKIKEELEDENVLNRIHSVLFPQEFTKLDGIVDLVFATAEEFNLENSFSEQIEENGSDDNKGEESKSKVIANFHSECIARVQEALGINLVKETRTLHRCPEKDLSVACSVSKFYEKNKMFWYGIHPPQIEKLEKASESYFIFGCKDEGKVDTFLIPAKEVLSRLDEFNVSELEGRPPYWHIYIYPKPKWTIRTKPEYKDLNIEKFRV